MISLASVKQKIQGFKQLSALQHARYLAWLKSKDAIFITALIFALLVANVGIDSLIDSPRLVFEGGRADLADHENIISIHHVTIDGEFYRPMPDYQNMASQLGWWRMQKVMSALLTHQKSVEIIIKNDDKEVVKQAQVVPLSGAAVMDKIGYAYIVSTLYLVLAVLMYFLFRFRAAEILSYVFIAAALYIFSLAPVITRDLTLHYPHFAHLLKINFFSSMGSAALAHFAVVFSGARLPFLLRRVIVVTVYLSLILFSLLFMHRYLAFGYMYYINGFWALVTVSLFVVGAYMEKDRFLRRQIVFAAAVPVLASAGILLYHSGIPVLGDTPMRIFYFCLLSLILPLSLLVIISNVQLYRKQMTRWIYVNHEAEKTRKDFHVNLLQRFADIALYSENAIKVLQKSPKDAQAQLRRIFDTAVNFSKHSRYFLSLMDERSADWAAVVQQISRIGLEMCQKKKVQFKLNPVIDAHAFVPMLPARVCLYYMFTESMANALKHAGADTIECRVHAGRKSLLIGVRDNGKGFDSHGPEMGGHYGLKILQRRLEEMHGKLSIESAPGEGTTIMAEIPLL